MNQVIIAENGYMDLASPISNEPSPYSNSYPIELLSNGLKQKIIESQNTVSKVFRVLGKASPLFTQLQEATKKGYRYVVHATDNMLEDIDRGSVKLTTGKNGELYAQIREANGQYGSKLPIKKEDFAKGIDPVQMANALQIKALQEQIQQMAEQIAVIDLSVKEVIQGQQNDRIGLYYSGLSLYLEARSVNNSEIKKSLITQSLRALSEARFQLGLTMQSDIKYLADGEYKVAKGKSVELIDSRIDNINKSFAFIHQATMLRAAIYCNEGELSAMSTVLDEYSYFIDNVVAKNAGLLAQCDKTDTGTERGVWSSRVRLKLDVTEIYKQLMTPNKTIYIGITKES